MTAFKFFSKAWVVFVAGLLCGGVVWGLSVPLTGAREPFDSPSLYYPVAMLMAGVIAALPAPRCWWVAVIGIFLGERLYAFVMLPETRAWLLFGIVVNALIPTWLPAAIGAVGVFVLDRQLTKRSSGRGKLS
jgi:hypothetical protein